MVEVIPRSAWGARYPNGAVGKDGQPIVAPLPAREVWLHHSVTVAPDLLPPFTDDDAAIRTLELIGQQRFGQGISYTWPITPVGRVYEGHSVDRQGAHTGGRNSIARAICFVGNYDTAEPTAEMIESAAQLLVQEYRAGRLVAARLNGGHQQAPGASTSCPGRYGMAAIPAINARAAAILAGAPPVNLEEEIDMSARDDIVTRLDNQVTPTVQRIEAAVDALIDVAGRPLEAETRLAVRLDALTELVRQLAERQGSPVDMAAVEAVVEKGVADAISRIDTTVTVKPSA